MPGHFPEFSTAFTKQAVWLYSIGYPSPMYRGTYTTGYYTWVTNAANRNRNKTVLGRFYDGFSKRKRSCLRRFSGKKQTQPENRLVFFRSYFSTLLPTPSTPSQLCGSYSHIFGYATRHTASIQPIFLDNVAPQHAEAAVAAGSTMHCTASLWGTNRVECRRQCCLLRPLTCGTLLPYVQYQYMFVFTKPLWAT